MESKILNIETVTEYNDMLGVETLHPLVSVINLEDASRMRHLRHTFSFYVIFLKDEKNCDLIYGRNKYDYQQGSVVCLAPGQIIGVEDNGETFQPKGWAICFHPDLIRGTSLSSRMKEYSYFSYAVNEAVHLSLREREIFIDSLQKIRAELTSSTDRLSRRLIVTHIELLLDYCLRFYERQFITREIVNSDILARFEHLLSDYFDNNRQQDEGLPSVAWCAGELCLSPKYFSDLMKKETGHTAIEHIHKHIVDRAKEMLLAPGFSISEVSYRLGFQQPAHFSRMFKSNTGQSPNEYRLSVAKN